MMNRFKPKVAFDEKKPLSPHLVKPQYQRPSNSRSPSFSKKQPTVQDVGKRIAELTGKYKATNNKKSPRSGCHQVSETRKSSPIRRIMERLMIPEKYLPTKAPEISRRHVGVIQPVPNLPLSVSPRGVLSNQRYSPRYRSPDQTSDSQSTDRQNGTSQNLRFKNTGTHYKKTNSEAKNYPNSDANTTQNLLSIKMMETFKVYQKGKESARSRQEMDSNLRNFEDTLAKLIADTCGPDQNQNQNIHSALQNLRNHQLNYSDTSNTQG